MKLLGTLLLGGALGFGLSYFFLNKTPQQGQDLSIPQKSTVTTARAQDQGEPVKPVSLTSARRIQELQAEIDVLQAKLDQSEQAQAGRTTSRMRQMAEFYLNRYLELDLTADQREQFLTQYLAAEKKDEEALIKGILTADQLASFDNLQQVQLNQRAAVSAMMTMGKGEYSLQMSEEQKDLIYDDLYQDFQNLDSMFARDEEQSASHKAVVAELDEALEVIAAQYPAVTQFERASTKSHLVAAYNALSAPQFEVLVQYYQERAEGIGH